GVPFDLLLSTDAYYFALLPVVEQIGTTFGIHSLSTTYAMIIGKIVGTFVSPFSPALGLALGLAGLELGRHIRYSLFWMCGLSVVLLIISVSIGVIEFYAIIATGIFIFPVVHLLPWSIDHFMGCALSLDIRKPRE